MRQPSSPRKTLGVSVSIFVAALLMIALASCDPPKPTITITSPALNMITTLVSTAAATGPATLAANATAYTIDAKQSLIKYLATGPFNIQLPGTFAVTGQAITLTPDGDGERVAIVLTFDLKSATATDSFMRDTLLNSLEVRKYPIATLTLASKDSVRLPADSTPITFTTAGTYDLHGQQHIVEVPMTLSLNGNAVTVDGSMTFKLSDYNISISSFVVSDQIQFTAHLVTTSSHNP